MLQHSGPLEARSSKSHVLKTVEVPAPGPRPGAGLSDFARRVAPYLDDYRVTRVGSVTALDVMGVPVWFACRPGSLSLAVSQGKGMTDMQAFRSAVMECLEAAVAEQPEHNVAFRCSVAELLQKGHAAMGGHRFASCMAAHLKPDMIFDWVKGHSIFTNTPAYFPFEIVCMDFRPDSGLDSTRFRISSVGLAGHINLDDAILHGLLEVIENDATALSEAFRSGTLLHQPVTFERSENRDLQATLARVRDTGFAAQFYMLSQPADIPVVRASVYAGTYAGHCRYLAGANGYACRFDIEDAALAALLEAIQTRATEISGARDDIEAALYPQKSEQSVMKAEQAEDFGIYAYAGPLPECTAAKLEATKRWLKQQDCPDAYVVPLGRQGGGLHFVKLLVPGLDLVLEGGSNRISKRMLGRMMGRALS